MYYTRKYTRLPKSLISVKPVDGRTYGPTIRHKSSISCSVLV